MSQQPMDSAVMAEVRRLALERAAKKRELDDLDKSIERLLGVGSEQDRPARPRQSAKDLRNACGVF